MRLANVVIRSIFEGKINKHEIEHEPLKRYLQKLCDRSKELKRIEFEGELHGDETIQDISFIRENDRSYIKEFMINTLYINSDNYSDQIIFYLNNKGRLIRIQINEDESLNNEEEE